MAISDEKKFRFLSRVYFGVSDNPKDDVNPFNNVDDFMKATVGDLRWGQSLDVRQRSKIRFVSNFSKVLDSFYITLKVEDAWASMQDDQKTNHELVTEWVNIAKFK